MKYTNSIVILLCRNRLVEKYLEKGLVLIEKNLGT